MTLSLEYFVGKGKLIKYKKISIIPYRGWRGELVLILFGNISTSMYKHEYLTLKMQNSNRMWKGQKDKEILNLYLRKVYMMLMVKLYYLLC